MSLVSLNQLLNWQAQPGTEASQRNRWMRLKKFRKLYLLLYWAEHSLIMKPSVFSTLNRYIQEEKNSVSNLRRKLWNLDIPIFLSLVIARVDTILDSRLSLLKVIGIRSDSTDPQWIISQEFWIVTESQLNRLPVVIVFASITILVDTHLASLYASAAGL